jgi:gamma-glutamylputrescine oxidase
MNRLPHAGRKGNVFYAYGFFLAAVRYHTTLADSGRGCRSTLDGLDVFANLPHRPFPGGKMFARPLATLGCFTTR